MNELRTTGAAETNGQRVVVGVDGSPGSVRAMSWVAARFTGTATEVIAVHALSPLAELVRDLPPMGLSLWRRELRRTVEGAWCEPLGSVGLRYRALIVESAPAAALSRVAEHEHADLIVIGECRHHITERLRGVVALHLAHRGLVPVVVVPLAWAPAASGSGTESGAATEADLIGA